MRTLINYLIKCNNIHFILINLLPFLILGGIELIILHSFNTDFAFANPIFGFNNLYEIVFLAVLTGPFFETVFFQFGGIEFFTFIARKLGLNTIASNISGILISSGIFGYLHLFGTAYQIATFIAGIFFGICYVLAKKRKKNNYTYAVFMTAIVHSLNNLLSIIGYIYFDFM